MSIQANNLFKRITNVFTQSTTSVLYQIINGIGSGLDTVDPNQIGLADQFSVTSSSGSALDKNGADWGLNRRSGETDDAFRQRILAELPTYASGPTVSNIKAVVRAFTKADPDIFEYGPDGFTMGASAMGSFGFSAANEAFTFRLTVYNPLDITYSQSDLTNAVNNAIPARSNVEYVFVGGFGETNNAALTFSEQ